MLSTDRSASFIAAFMSVSIWKKVGIVSASYISISIRFQYHISYRISHSDRDDQNGSNGEGDCFFKWANPVLFFDYFQFVQSNITILEQINVKNIHPVSAAGIRTHNLLIVSFLP